MLGSMLGGEVVKGYGRRMWTLFWAWRFDLIIIEKELFPFFPAFAERMLNLIGVPYLIDYDDALFHNYDLHPNALVRRVLGRKIDAVMRYAAVVVAGNTYLAKRAESAGVEFVEIIPTVVDCKKYTPAPLLAPYDNFQVTVGWIGTPKTSKYLLPLMPVFEKLQRKMSVKFVAVGARPEDFEGTPVEVWSWSKESEIASIQRFDIGIMPLSDTPWERGKCGYKLIQYMACGVPVVASPVGVNREIVKPGKSGYLAATEGEWEQQLEIMIGMNAADHKAMGAAARKQVEEWFSLQAQAPRLLAAIQMAGKHYTA